jgi:phosphopantothenoylcysteine synthetase/decarboxylase
MFLENKNIVLGVCGGIAAYKACDIIRQLTKLKANVECVLTKSVSNFITPLTLRTLSKNKVHQDMFESIENYDVNHISLAKKADIIVVAPATADTIARLAVGRANDLLSSVILASKAKILICPSMNSNMLSHKAVYNNIIILKSYGYNFVMPESGELACGDCGDGRLAKIEVIVSNVVEILS